MPFADYTSHSEQKKITKCQFPFELKPFLCKQWSHVDEWNWNSIYQLLDQIEATDQLHTPTALPSGKGFPIAIKWEEEWTHSPSERLAEEKNLFPCRQLKLFPRHEI